ncbi:MAG TPA: hypothetical protein VIV11_36490 [Kofleriaceae bacterium]
MHATFLERALAIKNAQEWLAALDKIEPLNPYNRFTFVLRNG